MPETPAIAVIGGGISGLAAAWFLSQRYAVSLFEREPQLGGHAHTVTVPDPNGSVAIDTGFVVFNERNYPLLTRFFQHLDVATQDTDMSFAYALEPTGIVYSGTSINTLFAQRRNLLRPRFLRMVTDIVRFNRLGKHLLDTDLDTDKVKVKVNTGDMELTLGDFLARHRFGVGFQEDYLLPMAAAIWSCPLATMRDFPVRPFLRFFRNHGLLDLADRPQWRTVCGGSQAYVARVSAALTANRAQIIHDPVRKVRSTSDGWQLQTANGGGPQTPFSAVVLACHADTALNLLDAPDAEVATTLAACRSQDNHAILHTDITLLPRLRQVWSSWNYMAQTGTTGSHQVSVSYHMNRLHRLHAGREYIISLNPWRQPAPETVLAERHWRHPIMDRPALAAQAALPDLQGIRGLYFAGAWTGYGFHEDGIRSALNVAKALGIDPPWQPAPTTDTSEGSTRLPGGHPVARAA